MVMKIVVENHQWKFPYHRPYRLWRQVLEDWG